jgi:hypothetical protein
MRATAPRSRGLAAVGATLGAWIAADALLSSGLISGQEADAAFFWFWGAPFAAAAAFLGWYAVAGGRSGVRTAARHGCVGGLVAGGGAFFVLGASRLFLSRGVLDGVVYGLRYAPVAAAIGMVACLAVNATRGRRSP